MEIIDLHDEDLSTVPEWVFDHPEVQKLIPDTISLLINLQELYIDENELDQLPATLSLRKLTLDSNMFSTIPRCVFGLTNLNTLSLSDTGVEIIR